MNTLPCAFCGYDPEELKKKYMLRAHQDLAVCDLGKSGDHNSWAVVCPQCQAQGPLTNEDNALPLWNKRAFIKIGENNGRTGSKTK